MDSAQAYGFAALLAQSDAVGKSALLVLLAMSLASWYLIISKAIQAIAAGRRSGRFLADFWAAPTLEAGAARVGARKCGARRWRHTKATVCGPQVFYKI